MWQIKKTALILAVFAALSVGLASAQTIPGGPGGGSGTTTTGGSGGGTTGGGAPGTSGWEITYAYEGTSKTTYTVLNESTGQRETAVDNRQWPSGPFTSAQSISAGQAPIVGDMVHAGENDGTVTVRVKWLGPASSQPTEVYLAFYSSSTGFWAIGSAGSGGGDAQVDNGLRVGTSSVNQTPTNCTKSISGTKRARYNYSGGHLVIPIKVKAKGYANGIGSQGTASCYVHAWVTSKALFIHSPVTYKRSQSADPYTGQIVGLAVLNQPDAVGNNYGDYGVVMTKMGGVGNFYYDYGIGYAGNLVGAWGNDHQVYNVWHCDKPEKTRTDPAFSEAHGMNVSDSYSDFATPLNIDFVKGATIVQKVNWKATDQLDGLDDETNFFMTLHPHIHKEEEYRASYTGYLHNPVSMVSAKYPASVLLDFYNPNPVAFEDQEVEVSHEGVWEESWEAEGTIGLTIADILNLTYGEKKTISTTSTLKIGLKLKFTIPANHSMVLWALPKGKVSFWNMSRWGEQGYQGDVRVTDVRNVTYQQSPQLYPGGLGGPPPLL